MKLLLSVSFLMLSAIMLAQPYPVQHDSTHTFYAEVGLGLAVPQGSFKYSYDGENEGFATTGINVILSAKTYKNDFFGLKYRANIMINPADASIHERADADSYTIKKVGKWVNVFYGFGPIFYHSFENSLFEFSLLGGFISSTRPTIYYRYFDPTGLMYYEFRMNGGYGLGLGFMPELSYSVKMNETLSLKFYVNYVYAKSKVTYKLFGGSYDNNTGLNYIGDQEQRLKLQSLNGGLCFVILL